MNITIGNQEYKLKANLGTSKKLEEKFKMPLTKILNKIGDAEISELLSILKIANANKDTDITNDILENWDYTDLQYKVFLGLSLGLAVTIPAVTKANLL